MSLISKILLATVLLSSLVICPEALAEKTGEKLLLEFGSLSTNVDSVLRIDGSGGLVGSSIDLEDDLGFETGKQINRFDLRYRFTDKHSLKYSFFQLDRVAVYSIDRTLIIGDTEFPIQANLSAQFDYRVHSVSYGRSLRSDQDSDLDLLMGLYYISTRFSVRGSDGGEEDLDGTGPVPMVGLNYERNLSGKWNLGARATIFKLDVGDFNGSVFDTRIRVDYQITDRFGLGLAYNWQRLNAGVKDVPLVSDFDMTMDGAEISAILRF